MSFKKSTARIVLFRFGYNVLLEMISSSITREGRYFNDRQVHTPANSLNEAETFDITIKAQKAPALFYHNAVLHEGIL